MNITTNPEEENPTNLSEKFVTLHPSEKLHNNTDFNFKKPGMHVRSDNAWENLTRHS